MTACPGTIESRRRRFEVRVSAEQDALIRATASLAGTTVTAFFLATAMERARAIVRGQPRTAGADGCVQQTAYRRFAGTKPPSPELGFQLPE